MLMILTILKEYIYIYFFFFLYACMISCVQLIATPWTVATSSSVPGFLGWKDPLEKEMATHYSIFAWRIPWREEPDRLQSMGLQRVGHDWATNIFTFTFTLEWVVISYSRGSSRPRGKACISCIGRHTLSLSHLESSYFLYNYSL